MTAELKTKPLSAKEAIAQVAKWIDDGMPGGKIAIHHSAVTVEVDSPASVDIWCAAMNVKAEPDALTYGVAGNRPRPVSLPGWSLDVWCESPFVEEPPFRIEVTS